MPELKLDSDGRTLVSFILNGKPVSGLAEPRMLLTDFLRQVVGITDVHVGCEHGICGACTVRIDGEPARSCLTFAVQIEGRKVETVQGLIDDGQALGGVQHDVGDPALDELEIEDFAFGIDFGDKAVVIPRVRLPVHIGNKEFLALLVADETVRRFQPGNLSRVEQTRGTCKQTPGQCRPQKGAAKCVGG